MSAARLTFLGAARNVTGSRYLLEVDRGRFLIDCGMYQERNLEYRNWEPFPVPPRSIDAVLVTHAHLDHAGYLPRLARDGFAGKVFCTSATADMLEVTLMNSAKVQVEDVEQKRKRHQREGRVSPHPYVPLYDVDDARDCLPLLSPVEYEKQLKLGSGVTATFHEAGHILGSAMIKVTVENRGDRKTVVFSGDVGRRSQPILRDPSVFSEADYVVVESTYGDRLHDNPEGIPDQLALVVNDAIASGGNVIVPSFALERAQDILYHLNMLMIRGRLWGVRVFLDSPMAASATKVFERHPELFDREMSDLMRGGRSPFHFRGLTIVQSMKESQAIDECNGTSIIIAGSGMCTGGRIKHHLTTNISRPESTILFVGYQAEGTLGREIVDGASQVRIYGQWYPVKAKVVQMSSFSAHADRDGLLQWLSGFQKPPRQLFITHGEYQVQQHFSEFLKEKLGWNMSIPAYKSEVEL